MALFVGRLGPEIRTADLEDVFSRYGRMSRCEVKNGGMSERDAEIGSLGEGCLRDAVSVGYATPALM